MSVLSVSVTYIVGPFQAVEAVSYAAKKAAR